MLHIEITDENGTTYRLSVRQVQFIRRCPHCEQEFLTIDPDQIYPNNSHLQMAYQKRRQVRESRAIPEAH